MPSPAGPPERPETGRLPMERTSWNPKGLLTPRVRERKITLVPAG